MNLKPRLTKYSLFYIRCMYGANVYMKKKQKISELYRCAEIFDTHGHINASKWIRFVAKNLEKNKPSDYHKDYLEILDAFKSDICKDDFIKSVHAEIELILGTVLNEQREQKFNKILIQSWPLIHNWRQTQDNINSIQRLLITGNNPDDLEKNYYVLLFIYMLEVEGSFDDIIRTLYILALASRKRRIQYQKIFNKRLCDIKTEFINLGFSDILLRRWDDGHLRNSIAHARFSFDKQTGKMNFIDIHPWSNKKVYDESFSIKDFSEKLRMIAEVSHIFTDFIMLLRILDLIKYKWVVKSKQFG